MIPGGGRGLDYEKAKESGYTNKELRDLGFQVTPPPITKQKGHLILATRSTGIGASGTGVVTGGGIAGGKGIYQPPCVGGVCPSPMTMAPSIIGRTDSYLNMAGGTAIGQVAARTYQGIAGGDVGMYDKPSPSGILGEPFKRDITSKPSPAPKFAPGGFLAGQGLKPPVGQELMLEATTGFGAVTYLRDTGLMEKEFADYTKVDKGAAVGQFTSDLNTEWDKMVAEGPNTPEKAVWLTEVGRQYDIEDAKAAGMGMTLTENRRDFLSDASASYDTEIFSDVAKNEFITGNLTAYRKDLDTQADSNILTLVDDKIRLYSREVLAIIRLIVLARGQHLKRLVKSSLLL